MDDYDQYELRLKRECWDAYFQAHSDFKTVYAAVRKQTAILSQAVLAAQLTDVPRTASEQQALDKQVSEAKKTREILRADLHAITQRLQSLVDATQDSKPPEDDCRTGCWESVIGFVEGMIGYKLQTGYNKME